VTPRIGKLAAAVAFLALALVSCGDGSDDPPAAPPTTAATASPTIPATASTATTRTTAATTRECETVAFTPNSEDAASDVRATGLPCDEAEAFVRQAGMVTSSGGPQEVDVDGYHCVRTDSAQDPLPRSFYECTDGSKKITFVRS
jgi:hypothetical protein